MSEWLSYSLSDFLLFSPQTYFRQFALINEDLLPLPLALIALALGAAIFANRRAMLVPLALFWAGSAFLFHHRSYAEINWAADWFALGFAVQAAALVAAAFAARTRASPLTQAAGAAVALLYPLQALAFGRDWREAEIVGISPDATAIFTLLMLSAVHGRARWLLLPIPLLWCLFGLLTLWTMEAQEFWTLAALTVAGLVLFARPSR